MKITEQDLSSFDTELHDKVRALCVYLDCGPDDLKPAKWDHYGLSLFEYGKTEYAIGTNAEADAACASYIEGSIWTFNAEFILEQCDLPQALAPAIKAFQQKECEGANDALLELVKKCSSLESFVQAAISADGRGHFLSSYDGEENEQGEFYIYRTN